MTSVKIRHYAVKRGKGFWQPTRKMKAVGFGSVPCGPDGPAAWSIAEQWNLRWDETRSGATPSPAMASAQNLSFSNSEELAIYPPRSLGEAFRKYRRTEEWGRKAPRTREDWWRAWSQLAVVSGPIRAREAYRPAKLGRLPRALWLLPISWPPCDEPILQRHSVECRDIFRKPNRPLLR